MKLLSAIQKRNKLNDVYSCGVKGPGGACHNYLITKAGVIDFEDGEASFDNPDDIITEIIFQRGPRNEPESVSGVLDTDLLEIVRDRLSAFQKGEFATRENAIALTHIEEALLWMNKRTEDRAERNVLGTYKK